MRIWQDMPYKEIAEVIGKTEASCKMMFSRTIAKIRETMSVAGIILLFISKTPH
jgi:DNA-directed RNA polymerase specialized sigma24 family protein